MTITNQEHACCSCTLNPPPGTTHYLKNVARLLRSLQPGILGDALAFVTLVGIAAVAGALGLLASQLRQAEEPEYLAFSAETQENTDAPLLTPPPNPPVGLEAAILLEDAFAALRPSESIGLAQLRGRLVERGSLEAETVDIASLRNLLTSDPRFRVDSRASVRLADYKRTGNEV